MKINTVKQAVEFLGDEFDMYTMARSGSGKWYQLSDGNIGCEVAEDEDGNCTFKFNITLPYGQFETNSFHIGYLNASAGQLAFDRTTKVYHLINGRVD